MQLAEEIEDNGKGVCEKRAERRDKQLTAEASQQIAGHRYRAYTRYLLR